MAQATIVREGGDGDTGRTLALPLLVHPPDRRAASERVGETAECEAVAWNQRDPGAERGEGVPSLTCALLRGASARRDPPLGSYRDTA